MKFAVTAASGKLGQATLKELVSVVGKENVVAIARTPHKARNLGVELYRGDYNSKVEFKEAFQGVGAVVLVSSNDYPKKRLAQHKNVIDMAKMMGVKKVIYTSMLGEKVKSDFNEILRSHIQTEDYLKKSGLNWIVARNGIYIEPDIENLETYNFSGFISNCAAEGKCAYTSYLELARAYVKLLGDHRLDNETYNLCGMAITQPQLAYCFNQILETSIEYKYQSPEDFRFNRISALGNELGNIVGGVYEAIAEGALDVPSDFEKILQRKHLHPIEMVKEILVKKAQEAQNES